MGSGDLLHIYFLVLSYMCMKFFLHKMTSVTVKASIKCIVNPTGLVSILLTISKIMSNILFFSTDKLNLSNVGVNFEVCSFYQINVVLNKKYFEIYIFNKKFKSILKNEQHMFEWNLFCKAGCSSRCTCSSELSFVLQKGVYRARETEREQYSQNVMGLRIICF